MTQIDIFNGALGALGHDQAVVALDENSAVATWCNRYYDQCRKELLREINPQWARDYQNLGIPNTVSDRPGWNYSFQLPKSVVRLVTIRNVSGMEVPFKLSGNNVYTNDSQIIADYVKDVTDTTKFDMVFTRALMYKLAVDVSLPLTGKDATRKAMLQELAMAMSDARNMDAQDDRQVGQPSDPNWWANCRGAKYNPGIGTADGIYHPGTGY